jgi:hypothetical protein
LEEIGPEGALVQLENAVACPTEVQLDCPTAEFDGIVRECQYEEGLGYFARIAFNAGQRWSSEVYRPEHLLDTADLAPEPPECDAGCGAADWCPTQLVARAVDPEADIEETVRRVAQNIAVVCGEMDAMELAECFVHHFGAPTECRLFTTFVWSYRNARESLVDEYEQPISPLRQACNIAMLLASVPEGAWRSSSHVSH